MGAAAPFLPYIVAAVSAGATYVNNRNMARRQDEIAATNIRRQRRLQQDADAQTNQLIQQVESSNAEPYRNTALQQYLAQLGEAGGQIDFTRTGVGGEFDSMARDAAVGVNDYGRDIAGLFSRIDAAGTQRMHEGFRRGDYESALNKIRRYSQGLANVASIKSQGVHANPWLSAISDFGTGYVSGGRG
jgi:hypothetical protein